VPHQAHNLPEPTVAGLAEARTIPIKALLGEL